MAIVSAIALSACGDGRIDSAKSAVARDLLDPESATFRDVTLFAKPNGSTRVCGQVNAKNRFGGYVGYVGFVHDPGARKTVFELQQPPASADSLEQLQHVNANAEYVRAARDCN